MIPKIQLANEPLAPSTTQNTPRIAAIAAIMALTVNVPLMTKDATASDKIASSSSISNQLSDLNVWFRRVI